MILLVTTVCHLALSPLTLLEIRHTCEQADALSSYSYTQHDGRYYAAQDLVDGKLNAKLTTSWLKSEDGSDWSVRVEGDSIDHCEQSCASTAHGDSKTSEDQCDISPWIGWAWRARFERDRSFCSTSRH